MKPEERSGYMRDWRAKKRAAEGESLADQLKAALELLAEKDAEIAHLKRTIAERSTQPIVRAVPMSGNEDSSSYHAFRPAPKLGRH